MRSGNARPVNVAMPGMLGRAGRLNCPTAGTSRSASIRSPSLVLINHVLRVSSKSAEVTSVLYRMSLSTPCFAAVRLM